MPCIGNPFCIFLMVDNTPLQQTIRQIMYLFCIKLLVLLQSTMFQQGWLVYQEEGENEIQKRTGPLLMMVFMVVCSWLQPHYRKLEGIMSLIHNIVVTMNLVVYTFVCSSLTIGFVGSFIYHLSEATNS